MAPGAFKKGVHPKAARVQVIYFLFTLEVSIQEESAVAVVTVATSGLPGPGGDDRLPS